jgi:hypothetical protein
MVTLGGGFKLTVAEGIFLSAFNAGFVENPAVNPKDRRINL